MPEDPESKIGGTSVSLPPFLLSWPLCISALTMADPRARDHHGWDPAASVPDARCSDLNGVLGAAKSTSAIRRSSRDRLASPSGHLTSTVRRALHDHHGSSDG